MKHGSLFNGIGGFQLAAHWMGWENIFSCEIDEWCNKVTKKHFPNCIQHGDIKKTDFTIYRRRVDILSGGFPCQPFSVAGKRKGTEDERSLWGEMFRAIREIQPCNIVAENVPGLLTIQRGMVFEQVCLDLESAGYEVQPVIIPAASKDAEHKRERVWIIAHSKRTRLSRQGALLGQMQSAEIADRETSRFIDFIQRNSMPYVCRDHNGVSRKLDECRLQSIGNAIVPQVAYEIFKAIEKTNIFQSKKK